MIKILFIGSFLSKKKGTKGISEKIAVLLISEGFNIKLSSNKINKYFRLLQIVVSILLTSAKTVHFDVFSGSAFTITRIGSLIAKLKKKKIVFTLRGGALEKFTEVNKALVIKTLNRADVIQTPSLFLQNYFQSLGFNVHYLPNFIQLENFEFDRSKKKKYSLLWVRAFDTIYNPTIPVQVLSKLIEDYPDAHLTMIGPDKGELQNVKAIVKSLHLENHITFTGPVQNDQLDRFFQTHHVYLNTTSFESFGMAVVEAAACGIPIISNSIGEIPLIWKDRMNILLVENNEIQQFVNFTKEIFSTPELENSLSKNGRLNAEQYNWLNIKSKWVNLLKT